MRRNYGVRDQKNFSEYISQRYANDRNVRKSKARNYVWIVASTIAIMFIGFASNFIERCRTALIFYSTSFKICCALFCAFIVASFFCLSRVRVHKDHYIYFLWREQRVLSIITISCALLSIATFTYALWPAYEEASIVFAGLGALFIANLSVVILYD